MSSGFNSQAMTKPKQRENLRYASWDTQTDDKKSPKTEDKSKLTTCCSPHRSYSLPPQAVASKFNECLPKAPVSPPKSPKRNRSKLKFSFTL